MKQSLREINHVFIAIQDYIDPPLGMIENVKPDDQAEFLERFSNASTRYDSAVQELIQILPELTPEEIAEGYISGCRLLQRGLGGYMVHHFDLIYVPIMIDAIKSRKTHTLWMFLPALMHQSIGDAVPLLMLSLDDEVEFIRERALQLAYKYRVTSALPKIRSLADSNLGEITDLARKIIRDWK